jgi:kynurenine formamidase
MSPDQKSKLAYNGTTVTKEALSVSTTSENRMPTLDHWHQHGGLVARGVLIDYKAWYERKAVAEGKTGVDAKCDPIGGHRITVADMKAIAKDQNVDFRQGDVLIVRTGLTEVFEKPTPEDFAKMQTLQFSGVDGSIATAKWLWNQHFSAVAGDGIAFEALPPHDEKGEPTSLDGLGGYSGTPSSFDLMLINSVLHTYLLTMFGMSIGELWDLKALSAHCQKTGRYSFLLTSAPLNIPGLVGSPPNALAIF